MSSTTNGHGHPDTATSDRIRWTDVEIANIAAEWVEQRVLQPFESTMTLFEIAQRKAVPDRQRNLTGLTNCPELRLKMANLWRERMERAACEPQIVHVEVPQPPDYIDLKNRLDIPSLMAMLSAKVGEQLASVKPLLAAMSPQAAEVAQSAPLRPEISLLAAASAKPRKTRVLLVGPLPGQFNEIKTQTDAAEIPVELQWLDKDKPKSSVPISTDHVVCTRYISHHFEAAIKKCIPAGRYHHIEGGGIVTIVQKLRDIGSLLHPRA